MPADSGPRAKKTGRCWLGLVSSKGPQILQQRAWQSDLLERVPRLLEALLAPWPPFLMPFAIVLFIYLFIHLLFF